MPAVTTFHEQTDVELTLKLREVLKTLPPFTRDYFRAIEPVSTSRTRISYAYDIRIFFQFLLEENPSLKDKTMSDLTVDLLDQITALDVEEYMEYLKVYKGIDEKTNTNGERGIKRKLSSLRSFYNYYFKREMIHTNPLALIDMPKLHEKDIIRLDAGEVAALLDYVEPCGRTITGQRKFIMKRQRTEDLAIITLLWERAFEFQNVWQDWMWKMWIFEIMVSK